MIQYRPVWLNFFKHCKVLFLTVCLALVLTGCSRVKIVYYQLDWLLPLYMETYMDLSDAQSGYLDQEIEQLLAWHCSTQLKQYAMFFREANEDFLNGRMSPERIDLYADRVEHFWNAIMQRMVPVFSRILLTSTDAQRAELYTRLAEQNQEWLMEYKNTPAAELREDYRDKIEDTLERWFGPLPGNQQKAIDRWSENFVPLGEDGYLARRAWQTRLKKLGGSRDDTETFSRDIEQLLLDPKKHRPPHYQERLDENKKTTVTLLFELGRTLTPAQLDHLAMETGSIAGDFEDLACQPGPVLAAEDTGEQEGPLTE